MSQTVLILGATGRFGRNAATAFRNAGWVVHEFDRRSQALKQAAHEADVIVNAWNPPYSDWARSLPALHQSVIEVARDTGATVVIPGNVYVFGPQVSPPWSGSSSHLAQNPLGRIRIDMEEAYRSAPVKTIILRAGDFIDTCASGNWFDRVITKDLMRGRMTYPGRFDVPHAWAYLPDLARATVALAEIRHELPRFCDVPFAGFTFTANDLARSASQVLGAQVKLVPMKWWPIKLIQPFWREAPHLSEMRYLWNLPHQLDGAFFDTLIPDFRHTDLDSAIGSAIPIPAAVGQSVPV